MRTILQPAKEEEDVTEERLLVSYRLERWGPYVVERRTTDVIPDSAGRSVTLPPSMKYLIVDKEEDVWRGGSKEYCEDLANKMNEVFARYIMTQGTEAEGL